jgi:hypothetical protein
MPDVIKAFVDELRQRACEHPAITADFIAQIERVLTGMRKAAQELPQDFGHWWREAEAVISDRSLSVKAKLVLMGPIGDEMCKVFGGREDTIAVSSDRVH